MRQVPKYLIIGAGRVASHFCYYFNLLNIPFVQWSRHHHSASQLSKWSQDCTHVLVLINDGAIAQFVHAHPSLKDKCCVHFSGSLTLKGIDGAHPLMTFSQELYDLATYQRIPFILEEGGPNFDDLLPGLPNQSYKIPSHLKTLYHALCVISGNFTCLLWQKFFTELENTFHLPREVAYPYLERTVSNLKQQSANVLTGPLVRGDKETIQANLRALSEDPYQKIYQAFVEVFKHEYS